uniref:DDE-1 domain-containing protein n=1 Tax=Meloidogyne incognita TaxID=6306 RepID=A0A914NRU8_MELIC
MQTTVCQKPPEFYEKAIVDFIVYVRNKLVSGDISANCVYASDETAVWLDCSNSRCVAQKGSKDVSIMSSGHDKLRITVFLTGRMDGRKMKPYVLLPRKRPIPSIEKQFGNKLVLAWAGNEWMTDETTCDYLSRVLGDLSFEKRILIWDAYRCHISQQTKEKLRKMNVESCVIPGGTTKFIQPGDVVINSVFKSKIRALYEDWMNDGEKTFTAGGNMRAAQPEIYLQWILNAWESIPEEMVAKSFKVCGIAKNDEFDSDIHCMKPNGPCPNARELLNSALRKESLDQLADNFELIDLYQDEENGYISDSSLV